MTGFYPNALLEMTAEISRLGKYIFALKLLGGQEAEIERLDTELAELKDKRRICALELLPIVFSRVRTWQALYCFLQMYCFGRLQKDVATHLNVKAYQVYKHCGAAVVQIFSAEPDADVFAPLSAYRKKKHAIRKYEKCLDVMRVSIGRLADYFQFTPENRRGLYEQVLTLQDRLNEFEESLSSFSKGET